MTTFYTIVEVSVGIAIGICVIAIAVEFAIRLIRKALKGKEQ